MAKSKQTDVCLAILALLEIKINMPVNHTSAEGSSSDRKTKWKAHQVKQETWPEQRIQKATPLHSGHRLNTTTKGITKDRGTNSSSICIPDKYKLQDSSGDKIKDKWKTVTHSQYNPVWATIRMNQKKPQPSVDVSQEKHESWSAQIPSRMEAAAKR